MADQTFATFSGSAALAPQLVTPRLVLRPWLEADATALAELLGDWEVARMTGAVPHPYPVSAAEGWILLQRQFSRRGFVHQFAITSERGGVVGGIGLFRRTTLSPWEVGYWIGRPFWGLGYATEALAAIVAYGVGTLKFGQIAAGHYADNPASGRVLEKAGFRHTGAARALYSLARRGRAESVEMMYEGALAP